MASRAASACTARPPRRTIAWRIEVIRLGSAIAAEFTAWSVLTVRPRSDETIRSSSSTDVAAAERRTSSVSVAAWSARDPRPDTVAGWAWASPW